MAATNTKKATKKINEAFGQINSMLDNLKQGIDALKNKKEENDIQIDELKSENTALNTQINEAENFKASLEKLKG